YLASRIASGFFKTRVLLATLLAGSALFLLYESLWMLQAGRVKAVVTGMGGGVAALWGLAASSGRPGFTGFIKVSGRVRRARVPCTALAASYVVLHALISIPEQGLAVSTVVLALTLSFAAGIGAGVLSGAGWRSLTKPLYAVLVAILASTIIFLSISSVATGAVEYRDTQLVYASYQCQLCYTVLKGGFEGCDSFRTRQTLVLSPREDAGLEPGRELATGRIGLECNLVIDKVRSFNQYFPAGVALYAGSATVFFTAVLVKKPLRDASRPRAG
ncbi:MAG: hypothetical protein QXT93_13105, partial [Thermofilum sp.]